MGSQTIQSKLWGKQPQEWSAQEATGRTGYEFVLNALPAKKQGLQLLDIGCGTGYFCNMAVNAGITVTGFDATPELIAIAKQRSASATFLVGDMEELPFRDNSFDVVCGFNSFQYAADTKHAIAEAKRVLVNKGKFAAMIWGNKEDCEAATYLKALGSLMPPPPPGAPGPFALTENKLLENILDAAGFINISSTDVASVWDYPDTDTAIKALLSAGPAARAIEHSGYEKVREVVLESLQPFIQNNGHVVYHNKFRVVMAEK